MKTYLYTFTLILLIIITGCKNSDDKTSLKEELITTDVKNKSDTAGGILIEELSLKDRDTVTFQDPAKHLNKQTVRDSIGKSKEKEYRLVAYYFHPTARCTTCRNIESYSSEAIQEWEKNNDTKISWKELNIEDSVNEHYVKEYELEFSSLVIAKFTGSKRIKWKNLADTWKLVNDKESFKKYVKFELNQFIKD